MRIQLHALDTMVILGYFAGVLWLGLAAIGRGPRGSGATLAYRGALEEYLLAGRRLSLPLFVGTLVSTWYGGLLGIGEIAYKDGLVAWLTQGGFWYLSYVVFALLLAPRLSRSHHVTLPDQIGEMHGATARVIALALNFLNVVPVAYVLSLGLLVQLLTDWPLWVGVCAGTGVAVLYSSIGGFRAVVYTDLLQFVLMCTTVALLMIAAVTRLGGAPYLATQLPATHLRPTGSLSPQELFVWATIALSTLVDPSFYHRCYAAATPRIARRGILIAVGFWVLFDVCTTFTGLYARAALPGIDPRLAFPLLAQKLLPSGLLGLFFAGVLSTVMSTVDSYCFVGAMSLGHDLFHRSLRPDASDARVVQVTRRGIPLTAAFAIVLALLSGGSIKAIWKTLGSLSSTTVLVPMLFGLVGWRPRGAASAAMLGGSAGTLGWATLRRFGPTWARNTEAMLPGLLLSITAYVGIGARSSRRNADRDPEADSQ